MICGPRVRARQYRRRVDLRRTWPLVGRDGIVDDLLSDLTRGRLRVASLHGPSGIGKSRLMDELAARWSAGGRELLRLRGTEVAAQLPLGVLGPLLAVSGPEFDALRTDPVGVIRQARDAALALAPSGRLLVLVDDAQLVDPLSAAVLAGLLDLEVVLLVAAVREGEPASETVSSLWRSDRGRRVDLTPLDERGVLAALTAVLGGDVSHRTALEFQHASGGNPLLLRELALGALDAGTLRRIERVWQWDGVAVSTPGLRDLVLARLERLPPDARSALERVALCSALPIDEVPSELLGGLEALEEEGLVAIGDQGGALDASAAHPQYAAAALEAVPRMRAVRVLIEQSDAAMAAARTPQDEVRAATYRLEAGAPDNPALLASAAATARRLDDHVAAIRLATAAIDAGDDSTATLAVLGDSLRETGRSAEALEVLERALALERVAHPGSAEHASLVAAVAQATAHAGDRMVDAMDMLSRFASEHPEHRHVVGPVEVWLCFLWGAVDRALAVVDATTAGVTPVADRNAIEVMAALPLAAAGRADEATQLAARAVRDARSPLAGSPFTRRFAALVESGVALLSGDLATAERAGR